MRLQERIDALAQLGDYLQQDSEQLQAAIHLSEMHNRWFTKPSSRKAVNSIATNFLNKTNLENWVAQYPKLKDQDNSTKTVGLVMAGNIPAVGFHDLLSIFITGNRALIKFSDKDKYLIPLMLRRLGEIDERTKEYFVPTPVLKGFDAVIATGSDNSSNYFERYFGQYPNIIRRNRNSVAVLDGSESEEELKMLSKDIFQYFGLGCRSVSKVYLPQGYEIPELMRVLDLYKDIMDHNKYKNNFDYNRSIFLLNKANHFANDCIMLLEHESLLSRIATIHYEFYDSEETLRQKLADKKDAIQCIASKMNLSGLQTVNLGETQSPSLSDYADGVDTIQFLSEL